MASNGARYQVVRAAKGAREHERKADQRHQLDGEPAHPGHGLGPGELPGAGLQLAREQRRTEEAADDEGDHVEEAEHAGATAELVGEPRHHVQALVRERCATGQTTLDAVAIEADVHGQPVDDEDGAERRQEQGQGDRLGPVLAPGEPHHDAAPVTAAARSSLLAERRR
jgi:hypothetical protein